MLNHPLLNDCLEATGLKESQIEGALGLTFSKLKDLLDHDDFQLVRKFIPRVEELIQLAPATKKGFLGKLAGSVGGEKARILTELSQGMSTLGIPVSEQKPLALALVTSVEQHYPQLKPIFEKVAGSLS